jgi:glycosyltransferase involved in cell wall biosynthesis
MVKKKILLHMITGLGRGGAEAVLYQLLQNLDSDYFEHTVIYFYPGYYVEKIQKLGIATHQVSGLFFTYDPIFFYRLVSLIKQIHPDCVHTLLWAANFFGRIIASWYKIAHVEVFHNNLEQNGMLRNFLDRVTASRHGNVVAVSNGVAESLRHYAPWLTKPKVDVINNGISCAVVSEEIVSISKEQLGLASDHFIIGTVGRFEWVKNYSLLLTSFALLYDEYPQARLVLLGFGSQEYYLRQRAYDLGIDDRVLFVVGQDARRYYKAFDCFVMSSYKEGLSIALLEAMSNELAPIVIATNKKHDVVMHEENGLLVFHNDAQELADAIADCMNDVELRVGLAKNAKRTVQEKFKLDVMVAQYNALYKTIVASK